MCDWLSISHITDNSKDKVIAFEIIILWLTGGYIIVKTHREIKDFMQCEGLHFAQPKIKSVL